MAESGVPKTPPGVLKALGEGRARYLSRRNDRLTAELVRAMEAGGVRPIVLKGASTRAMLATVNRVSGDIDLLVAPTDRAAAQRILRRLGYRRELGVHADNWTSPDGPPVDLHRRLPRISVSASRAWQALQPHRLSLELDDGSIDILDRPAHLVHLAIHATHDGTPRSSADLRRGVELADDVCLAQALRLSEQLGARSAVAWAMQHADVGSRSAPFGDPWLPPHAPHEFGWAAFVRSPVHWEERRRRTARVAQMWLRWNAGRTWRVLTLRSNRVRRARSAVRHWVGGP